MTADPYLDFLRSKEVRAPSRGLAEVPDLAPHLFPYQRACADFLLRCGSGGLFLDTGLGKTAVELEWCRHAAEATNGRALILTPLAVARQIEREGQRWGYPIRVIRDQSEAADGINVCNYDRLDKLDCDAFGAVALDESSILKSFTGKTTRALIAAFAGHRFRLSATATPAPNDHMELGQHAEFCGVMSSAEMLSRFFINDTATASQVWRLKRHAETAFWDWMASWCRMASLPSHLGDADDGFVLPALNLHRHRAKALESPNALGGLFADLVVSATGMHELKRQTATERARVSAELVCAEPSEPFVLWCDTDYEADAILKALASVDGVAEVRGSHPLDRKEEALAAFVDGSVRVLVTKPSVCGFGLNWQHCARTIFVGRSFSYEAWYQAIRRLWRFGQVREVECHVIVAEGEDSIGRVIDRKSGDHERMKRAMAEAMRRAMGRSSQVRVPYRPTHEGRAPSWLRSAACSVLASIRCLNDAHGERFAAYHGDCVDVLRQLPSDSIGHSVYSPPFGNLFVYSESAVDMGNCATDAEFAEHYAYCVREMFRLTKPGRVTAVHCSDLPLTKWRDGAVGIKDFSGEIIRIHEDAGWIMHSRRTIWKCPVTEMTRTKHVGLLYKQLQKDSIKSRGGMPDYLITFVKPGENAEPIVQTPQSFPLDQWQEWASPVWMTVNQSNVLNVRTARGPNDERHLCPLQLDVIERSLILWSNPGDIVLSPFMGIGSEGYCALKLGRRFVGVELKEAYFRQAVEHLRGIDSQRDMFGDAAGVA